MYILWQIIFLCRNFKETHPHNSWRQQRLQMWILWKVIQPGNIFENSHQKDSWWSKESQMQHLQQVIYHDPGYEPAHQDTWQEINLIATFLLLFPVNCTITLNLIWNPIKINSQKIDLNPIKITFHKIDFQSKSILNRFSILNPFNNKTNQLEIYKEGRTDEALNLKLHPNSGVN